MPMSNHRDPSTPATTPAMIIGQLTQDLRYAWRGLWRSPAFVATTVVTLAVGLCLVTVVFAVFNAYVLRPFAVQDPDALYTIGWRTPDDAGRGFSWREYEQLQQRSDLFVDAFAQSTPYVATGGRTLSVAFVSVNYFDMLRPRMAMGRGLASIDAGAAGEAPVAVLSDEGWTRLYDRNPAVIGATLEMNRQRLVVVGVLGPEFSGLDDTPRDVFLPIAMHRAVTTHDVLGPDQPRDLVVVARLRRDVGPEQAASALTPLLTAAIGANAPRGGEVRAELTSQATPAPFSLELVAMLSPVFGAFALVLIAACANVSNVMLARANGRHRELGVRLSLGASRGRLVRQLVTEGLLIAVIAGVAGLALASLVLRTGTALFLASLPASVSALVRVLPLDLDARVFAFALIVAAGATLVFALLPALQSTRLTLTDVLRGQAGGRLRASTLRAVLVGSQVAVSLVLLIAAATIIRNGMALRAADFGFDTAGVYSVNQRARGESVIDRAAAAFVDDARVEAVAVTSRNPLFERVRRLAVTPSGTTNSALTSYTFVSERYFSLLRVPLLRGRTFLPAEATAEAPVAIVSAAAASAFWPGADPIGRIVRIEPRGDRPVDDLPGYTDVTVVGVVGDVVSGLVFDGRDAAHLYLPTHPTGEHAAALLVRGRSERDLTGDVVRTRLAAAHEDPLAFEALSMDEVMALQMYPLRAASWIGSLLGAIALALSVSGLYGVLTYTLSQRTREIGIRMALGATTAAVVALVMRQSSRLVGLGALTGLVIAFAVMRVLASLADLRSVAMLDAGAFAVGLALVLAAAGLAAYAPTRRATRIDPATTLRADQ